MSDQIPRSSRAYYYDLERGQTIVPADHFDELLKELDRPPVPNRRTAEAAERARAALVAYGLSGARAVPGAVDHRLAPNQAASGDPEDACTCGHILAGHAWRGGGTHPCLVSSRAEDGRRGRLVYRSKPCPCENFTRAKS